MKRQVTAREFLRRFSKMHQSLRPGQSITVTKGGKPLGLFVKQPAHRRRLPDFEKDVSSDTHGPDVGDALLKRLLQDEAVS